MNVYFLVEGKRTERKVYPKWLSFLVPKLKQVNDPSQVRKNNYFLMSGEGYPSLLDHHLPNALYDINNHKGFGMLVVCLDTEESTVKDISQAVEARCSYASPIKKGFCALRVIAQRRCIESWFLGNRKIVPTRPQDQQLRRFIRFHNVRKSCPEDMGNYPGYQTHAAFHIDYLRKVFSSKRCCYSKTKPGPVLERTYLQELENRVKQKRTQMATFNGFLALCADLRNSLD